VPSPHCLQIPLLSGIILTAIGTGCVEQRLYRQKWIPVAARPANITPQATVATGHIGEVTRGTLTALTEGKP